VERDFREDVPTDDFQAKNDQLDESGVMPIEQAVEVLTMPEHLEPETCAQRIGNADECPPRQPIAISSFHERDERSGAAGFLTQPSLRPTSSAAQRPQ
jgi:hypothetical protein